MALPEIGTSNIAEPHFQNNISRSVLTVAKSVQYADCGHTPRPSVAAVGSGLVESRKSYPQQRAGRRTDALVASLCGQPAAISHHMIGGSSVRAILERKGSLDSCFLGVFRHCAVVPEGGYRSRAGDGPRRRCTYDVNCDGARNISWGHMRFTHGAYLPILPLQVPRDTRGERHEHP